VYLYRVIGAIGCSDDEKVNVFYTDKKGRFSV